MTTESDLGPGLSLRPVRWADLNAVAQLIYDVCEADGDTTVAVTPQELEHEWHNAGFQLEKDAFLVETAAGRIVGYEEFANVQNHYYLRTDGYIHPEFKGRGVGSSLLHVVETRARQEIPLAESDVRVFMHSTLDNKDQAGHALHQAEGYFPKRYHWRMEIKLESQPPPAVWPAGIEPRPFIKDSHAVQVWEAQNESFRDHWGSHDASFDEFCHSRFDDPEYDPTLWVIAWDGDQVAGISINRFRMGIGWIRSLGVRRPWRKRGLGLALLRQGFGEFHRRGMQTIGLGVDASNPTGATRLYQRAGMRVASEFVTYEKELRPGRSLEE